MTFDTKIYLHKRISTRKNGVPVVSPSENPFATVWCKWKGAFGDQAIHAYEQVITDLASVTLRWSDRISELLDGTCLIKKNNKWYEIITEPSDVNNRRLTLEFKVKRWCDG